MKIIQVILALSILIIIHEFGHFLFARLFRIRVDKFFLFFDAGGFRLFSTKRTKWFTRLFPSFKDKETEYGIGWLPLGGYCKINGMIDESLDTKSLKAEPQPWEFRTKPAWQRALVMVGGVLFNFIFAILIYVFVLYHSGNNYISNADSSIYVNELAYEMGFRNGDRILQFDDYVPEEFNMLQADLARRNVHKAIVLRGTDTVTVYIDHSMIGKVLESPNMFGLAMPFAIDSVMAGSANEGSGLRRGDVIVGIDSMKVAYVQDAWDILKENAGEDVKATVLRGSDTVETTLQVDTAGRVGVYLQAPGLRKRTYTFAQAIPAGAKYTWDMIAGYARDLRLVATPSTGAYKSVGSFIAIGQVFPSTWDWAVFVNLLAILSIMLGVMNLIPIPGLDGGHLLFIIYEMVTRRKPSDSFMITAQMIGMMLLLALMVFACGNDIGRLLG